ncbi:MAG: hypothetical protein FJW53_01895 [Actinobacteria bacterium]|nr:hypothetical protein [Actinomycetota bacterium]
MAVVSKLSSVSALRDETRRGDEPDSRRPILTIVESRTSAGWKLAVCVVVAATCLLGVVGLQARMAQRQMHLDKINSDIIRARRHFDTLRARKAELQSPTHLIARAHQIGLVPGVLQRVVEIPPDVAAQVVATTGKIDDDVADTPESSLDKFGRLKPAVVGGS